MLNKVFLLHPPHTKREALRVPDLYTENSCVHAQSSLFQGGVGLYQLPQDSSLVPQNLSSFFSPAVFPDEPSEECAFHFCWSVPAVSQVLSSEPEDFQVSSSELVAFQFFSSESFARQGRS